jgi:hypothetical protein
MDSRASVIMAKDSLTDRSAVRRNRAASNLLLSLVAFAVTVIATRVYLASADYPQIGNDVLHIAHALWGGLFLFVAVLLPVAFANRWATQASAALGGMGIGLFIDEVGKFITQSNDYFFPPALAIIYGFFLLTVFVYLYFRRPRQPDPRQALYHAFEVLQDALDGDLDTAEAARIESQLEIALKSDRPEIVSLAGSISAFLMVEGRYLAEAEPDFWQRIPHRIKALGQRVGQRWHRVLIALVMAVWAALAVGNIIVLTGGGGNVDAQVLQWRLPLMAIEALVGTLMAAALVAWLAKREGLGLNLAISGLLLSLVALQTLYFYLSQFSAVGATLVQLAFLLVMLAYRRWYLVQEERL